MKAILILTVAATAFFTMQTSAQPVQSTLSTGSYKWESRRNGELKFLLHQPQEYSESNGVRWPLMLFLHGAGERGSDVQRAGIHGPMKLVRQGTNFPFIIVAPQCPENQRWDSEALGQLVEHVIATRAVDTNRIYVTGLSMGGFGTWSLGLRYPEKFAAIAPICGGGSMIDMVLSSPGHAAALRTLPVWAFHGAKDPIVPVIESERMIGAMKSRAKNADVKLTVYPEADHDSWTQTYSDPKFYDWLLAQRR